MNWINELKENIKDKKDNRLEPSIYIGDSRPLKPLCGNMYYDTDDGNIYMYDGIVWRSVANLSMKELY